MPLAFRYGRKKITKITSKKNYSYFLTTCVTDISKL